MITLLLSVFLTFLTSWGLSGLSRLLFSVSYDYDLSVLLNLSFQLEDLSAERLPIFFLCLLFAFYFVYLRGSNGSISNVKPT